MFQRNTVYTYIPKSSFNAHLPNIGMWQLLVYIYDIETYTDILK